MKKTFLLLFFSSFGHGILYAQKIPSTLLWKISGNGLEKPSYLYGTMHLTDERVFNLGDSLYKAIENSDGFAMEIDPDALTEMMIDEAKKSILEARKIKDMLSEKEFKKYGPALSRKLNKDEDDITTEDVFREKNKWVEESYRKGKMITFLDTYLFDIARRQGKWTGGVEDIDDHKNALDYLIDESDIQELAADIDNENDERGAVTMEQMIKYYTDNNLNAIDSISGFQDSLFHDALLTSRNKKMAMRMDSLGRERSMVFAVGAAHLPGSDGVIALLKQKGFTVTPVFSSKKIKPKDYKVAEIPLRWQEVKDEANFYTASMPGKAGNMELYGIMNMKMYFDVFSSTVYMTTAVNTPYSKSMADSIFGEMADYYFGSSDLKKGKPITINNVPGREFFSQKDNYSHGYLLFKDGIMYIALGISMKKDTSAAKSVNRFLHSFTILKNENNSAAYLTFTDKAKAYSIDLPAEPKEANDYFSNTEETSINRDLKITTDPQSGAYLLFGINEAAKGFYIESDHATLNYIVESQKDKFSTISIDSIYTKNNHGVLELGGMMATAPLMIKAYYEFRGNRWYSLVAIYDTAKTTSSIERFFSSFKMLDYPEAEWKQYAADDNLFKTWAPSGFSYKAMPSLYSNDTTYNYESFDTTRADDFTIVPLNLGKYYWQSSDSVFWESMTNTHVSYDDSLISKKNVTNGDANGIEITVQKKDAGNIVRKRMLLNGNIVYTLLTVQPFSEIYNANNNKFFEDFRFNKPVEKSDLLISKAVMLLNDLGSSDSAVQTSASNFLQRAPFTKQELPLLHEALLKKYPVYDDYQTTNELIEKQIINLNDSASYLFAKNNYLQTTGENKNLLLEIMASFPTQQNFNDIKMLMLQSPPEEKLGYTFINQLTDTLQLTATIFPGLLPLIKDTIMSPALIKIASPLLDSSLINAALLQPYQENILLLAEKNYTYLKSDPDNYDRTNYSLIDVLEKMNTPACNAELQAWSQLEKHPFIQLNAISSLLENDQTLNAQVLKDLAADKESRTDLYERLKTHKKESLFPKKYFTQKDFAESYVYSAASDDDEPADLTYLTKKVVSFNGSQARFFFYKVTYGEDDYKSYRLACAGPFSLDGSDISADKASGSLYYDKDFDTTNLSNQMDALIKQVEDWYKTKDEDEN